MRSAMRAANQLPGGELTDVEMAMMMTMNMQMRLFSYRTTG